MPRFLAARPSTDLIRLPWNVPLAQWPADQLVALPRGISRHVVRFIEVGDEILAAKEILEEVAVHEYRQLTELRRLGVPSVEPIGVVLARSDVEGNPLDTILLTRHLSFSLPYRALFYAGIKLDTVNRLLDAMVARARELGCKTVDLTSRPSREAANHLYRKIGFEPRETNVYRYDLKG